jgi:hypothetical protein
MKYLLLFLLLLMPAALPAQDVGINENRYFLSVKTNVALWGLDAIANAEAELFLPVVASRAFSINLPVVWSPYTVSGNWKYRIFALQPEFRWWLGDAERWWLRQGRPENTHFVGVHTHLAWFNVAVNRHGRYQGKEGTALPLWGAGLSYGYALTLPWWKSFGAEFTLGLGYAHITYDIYHNDTPNGAKYATGVRHYWGVTRAGISLVYHF